MTGGASLDVTHSILAEKAVPWAPQLVDNLGWSVVELGGLEPPTPSLRTMQSKRSDQGIRRSFEVLWRGCGTTDVTHSES